MAHAEKCPICLGEGFVYKVPKEITGVFTRFLLQSSYKQTCHGCGGKGWIEIQDQQPGYWPWPSYDISLDTITQPTKGTITGTNTS